MAHPKRQHSHQRTNKRRSQWKIKLPSMGPCSQCKKPVLSHRVCPFCGYYKGKMIIEIVSKKEKEEAKRKEKQEALHK